MRRPTLRYLSLSFLLFAPSQMLTLSASAETRVALVIGQSAYRAVPTLPNAANDAKRMSELLSNAGFDVTAAADLSQTDMRQAISDFAGTVSGGGQDTIALIFYAGHGVQIDGENYLIPVDVDPKREADIPLQALRFNDVMNTLGSSQARMRIYLLDACRNNPFPALNQTAGHGLAIVDTKAAASGSFISYSTSPGAEAEDGTGEDSPYTTAVLSVAREPNVPVEQAFKRIRVAVNEATEGRQTPWESSSLTSDFKFFSTDPARRNTASPNSAAPAQRSAMVATRSVEDWRKELQDKEPKAAYQLVIADDSLAAYEAYVELFEQEGLAPRVRSLLDRRREMIAWESAVVINTGASFDAFLASYPNSDLAATARKLLERVRNRSFGGAATAAAPHGTSVALAPSCPCSPPPLLPSTPTELPKRVDVPATKPVNAPPIRQVDIHSTKRVDTTANKRGDRSRAKRKPPPNEVLVERRQPPQQSVPPRPVMEGVRIGVGARGRSEPMPRSGYER